MTHPVSLHSFSITLHCQSPCALVFLTLASKRSFLSLDLIAGQSVGIFLVQRFRNGIWFRKWGLIKHPCLVSSYDSISPQLETTNQNNQLCQLLFKTTKIERKNVALKCPEKFCMQVYALKTTLINQLDICHQF